MVTTRRSRRRINQFITLTRARGEPSIQLLFPELAMAEGSPQRAYEGVMATIEKVWAVK